MSSAVASALKAKPLLLNVHALSGPEAMSKCVKTAESAKAGTKLIAVTILTSYDEAELNKVNIKTPMDKTVVKLCKVSLKSGMDGVVASAMEISTLRWKFGKDFLIVTPGIRPKWAVKNDQKRIATPYKAIKDGADYIVVGRPILLADDPLKAAKMVIKEIKEALA